MLQHICVHQQGKQFVDVKCITTWGKWANINTGLVVNNKWAVADVYIFLIICQNFVIKECEKFKRIVIKQLPSKT